MGTENFEQRKATLNFSEKLILYSAHYVHLIYLFLVWILSLNKNLMNILPNELIFTLYIFIIISAFSTIITYKYIIPKMMKKDDANSVLFIMLHVLIVGSEVPSTLGVIFAIIGLTIFSTLYWQIGLVFIVIGFTHSIYLHFFKIQPFLNNLKNK
ncbi:MAG: hypothetical protein ACTSP9_09785 [Promethearchaeota archaeon]